MSPSYKIALLKEERNSARPKDRPGYDRDIRKLEKALAAITAAELAVETAKANFDNVWGAIC